MVSVRLDQEQRQKLADLAARRGVSTSKVVRDALDTLFEADGLQGRLQAAHEIAAMNIGEMPEPDELSRQLDSTYDIGPLP